MGALTAEHRVIRYDARGFGHSPASKAKFTLLTDLIVVLDHFGLQRVPMRVPDLILTQIRDTLARVPANQ
jgi:pimeloyl-ACP methyl ester carboxylesterase